MLSVGEAVLFVAVSVISAATCSQLRLNEAQVVGTHNSYHLAPAQAIQDLAWNPLVDAIAASYAQSAVNTTQYNHLSLYDQLDIGVRSIEIDIYPDPSGNTYDQSVALQLAGVSGWQNNSGLQAPGFKVMHVPDIDFGSTCLNFTNCMGLVQAWHQDNPDHFPLTLFLNQKVDGLASYLGDEGSTLLSAVMNTSTTPGPNTYITVPPFDDTSYEQIEAQILTFFNRSDIVTPDEVRGSYSTLSQAVLQNASAGYNGPGWPLLDSLRGRIFLVWTPESDGGYLGLHPNLAGALCWVSGVDGNSGDDGGTTTTDPAIVFIQTYETLSWSSPVTSREINSFNRKIAQRSTRARELVNAGYMTISFVDEDCNEARYNYTNRRDALSAAGSQILKTNFPTPPTFFPSNFTMAPFDSNLGARCNPVNTQTSTTPAADGNTTATFCSVADLQPASTASVATAG